MIHACFPFYNFVHTPYNYPLRNYVFMQLLHLKYEEKFKGIFINANTSTFSSDSRYAIMIKKVVGIFDQIE